MSEPAVCPDCTRRLPPGGYLADGWHAVQPVAEQVARRLFMHFIDKARERVGRALSDEEMHDLSREAHRIAAKAQPVIIGKCPKQLERDTVRCLREAAYNPGSGDATLDELEGRT